MKVKTTINLNEDIVDWLTAVSENTGQSRSKIIALLMNGVMQNNHHLLKSFSRVRYQQRDPERKWCRLHISLKAVEYEYALDLRKFCKMSFSAIIAYAAEEYLEEIQKDLQNPKSKDGGDNYSFKNYIFVKEYLGLVQSWRVYWGIPQNLAEIIPITDL